MRCMQRDNLGYCHHVPTLQSAKDFAPPHNHAYTDSALCKVLRAGSIDFCMRVEVAL